MARFSARQVNSPDHFDDLACPRAARRLHTETQGLAFAMPGSFFLFRYGEYLNFFLCINPNGGIFMHAFVTVLLFVVGVALVIKGGDWFVDAASRIAKALNVPTFIIGATIVSLATTLPEMIVSALAAAQGKTDMAVGNAVGSVTANLGLILGVAMVAMAIAAPRKKFLLPILLHIAAGTVLLISCRSGRLSVPGSIVLGLIFLTFMVQNVLSARSEPAAADSEPRDRKGLLKDGALFLLGAAAIVAGSQLMVNYGGELAVMLGVPERVIAVTLVAIGTSLPELVTTITAIVKKEAALSIGNIIGANIIDLSLILPVCSIVGGEKLPVSAQSILLDIPVCLAFVLVALVPLLLRQKSARVQGVVLLLGYAAYLAVTVL